MSLNTAVMFGKASDEWETPVMFFAMLDREFHFATDAAASSANTKCLLWFGPGSGEPDALAATWWPQMGPFWLNPPYSKCRAFIAKAADAARRGCTVVCLVPSRTDTRWWHEHVWDAGTHQCREGVEVRFLKGRLKFGNTGKPLNSAPFPSVVIVFRGQR